MSGNKAVAYKGPGKVEVIDTDYPTFELKDGPGVNPANIGRKVNHGVILKTVATNICGARRASASTSIRTDQAAPTGMSTWAAGWEARPNTFWSPMPTGTC